MFLRSLFLFAVFFSFNVHAQNNPQRPPQYVLLAFDGSLNLAFWKESRQFSQTASLKKSPLKFTYFLSGVYFLANSYKNEYAAPLHGAGHSAIGFGGPVKDIPLRVAQLNAALLEGHEMGSHANGHFDADEDDWTGNDWASEFEQFTRLIFQVFSINKVSPLDPGGLLLKREDVIGFRAPQLGVTDGLWPVLQANGFRYDTSRTNSPQYWPKKNSYGTWNFPLARIDIVGTSKKTLSMDYNFYVSQSSGEPDPTKKELYKKQMYESYLKYFQDNYNGNRAPLHIGHHFSKWNDGAYWEALQDFALTVCGLPEVKCTTYREYMNWLESLAPKKLANYSEGKFIKSSALLLTQATALAPTQVNLVQKDKHSIQAQISTADRKALSKYQVFIFVNGHNTFQSVVSSKLVQLYAKNQTSVQLRAVVVNEKGIEIARSTQILANVFDFSSLSSDVFENQSLRGDLPAAHLGE